MRQRLLWRLGLRDACHPCSVTTTPIGVLKLNASHSITSATLLLRASLTPPRQIAPGRSINGQQVCE